VCLDLGPACDDGNDCTADICDAELGCRYTSALDGTSCEDEGTSGVCIGGVCIPDSTPGSGEPGSEGGGDGSGGRSENPSEGISADDFDRDRFQVRGSGFCSFSPDHRPWSAAALWALALGLGAARFRRREQSR
jgi:MYXO-CTERM domain-containing protein